MSLIDSRDSQIVWGRSVPLKSRRLGSKESNLPKNSKGCDIGYALAANSCEGVNNVDACTVTALDATTAFAVPDPNLPLAEPVGFFGSGCSLDRSTEPDHSVYFGSATVYFD
jgi:hypothetical protein